MATDKRQEELKRMEEETEAIKTEHKAAQDLFEKQKDEAMKTMKEVEALKEKLSKSNKKTAHKIQILKALSTGGNQEL